MSDREIGEQRGTDGCFATVRVKVLVRLLASGLDDDRTFEN